MKQQTKIECIKGTKTGGKQHWSVIICGVGNFPLATQEDVSSKEELCRLIYQYCLDKLAERDQDEIFRNALDAMGPTHDVKVEITKLKVNSM